MNRYREKQGISQFFAILTLQTLLCRNMSAFLLETSISKNKGRGCNITL